MKGKGGKRRIMENKNNFMGIIIPIVVAVILLTVLPIINSINVECPPCEECLSYNIGNMEVNPDFSSGNYTVDKGDYDYLDIVTILKDSNLIPENIKKGVTIFGITGTYEEEVSYTVTLRAMNDGTYMSGHSKIYVKVGEAPTSDNDYHAMATDGYATVSYKSGSSASTFEGIKKLYIWGLDSQYVSYQIDNGSKIAPSEDWTSPTEIILSNNITLTLYTKTMD